VTRPAARSRVRGAARSRFGKALATAAVRTAATARKPSVPREPTGHERAYPPRLVTFAA
jgi:hypothetical protein